MGLERVKERVLEEARQNAKVRLDAATAEANEIRKSFLEKVKEKESALKSQLELEVASINRNEAATAKLESKKLLLTFRKDFIESIFAQTKENLSKLTEQERERHIKKLLKQAESELKAAVIYCNKKDAKYVSGYKVKEADITGGLIAETADGSLRADYSYEAILEQLKDSLLPELDKLLFTGKK